MLAGLALVLVACTAHADSAPHADGLDILVFGATGKVGVHVITEALQRGHRVTAVSRDPSRIETGHPNLGPAQGNILDSESVAGLLAGQDVVIVSVRGVTGERESTRDTVVLAGTQIVVEALRRGGDDAARLIHVGGSGSLEVEPGVLFADRIPRLFIPKSLELEIAAQVEVLDFLRTVNDIDWTYVTPPKNFTNGKRTGEYRVGGDSLFEDSRGRSRVSRADFAVALIDEAENAQYPQQRISIAY